LSFRPKPRALCPTHPLSSRPQPRAFCLTPPLSSRPEQRRLLPLCSGGIVAQSLDLERPVLLWDLCVLCALCAIFIFCFLLLLLCFSANLSELCVAVYPGPLGVLPSLFSFSLYFRPRLHRPLPTLRFLCGPSVLSVLSIFLFLFFPPLQTSASSAPPFIPTRSGRCLFLSLLTTENCKLPPPALKFSPRTCPLLPLWNITFPATLSPPPGFSLYSGRANPHRPAVATPKWFRLTS